MDNSSQLGQTKHVGYYGPRRYEFTMSGSVLVVIGLITLFSSYSPVGENQILHASIPVNIILGSVAVRISLMERDTTDYLKVVTGGWVSVPFHTVWRWEIN